jgi:hypothetical protein
MDGEQVREMLLPIIPINMVISRLAQQVEEPSSRIS